MFIKRAIVRGLKRLQFSEIEEINLEFNTPVCVISGKNGSGKSSLVGELGLIPRTRSDYCANGYSSLTIEHDGNNYILTSDYSNKTHPHSFIENTVEKNTSGTTDVQKELIEKYLSMSTLIRNLSQGSISLCQMNKSERKNLLLSLNPADLTFILETHKQAITVSRDLNASIKRLKQRQVEIEGQFLQADMLSTYLNQKTELEEKTLEIDKVIYRLDQHIDTITTTHRDILSKQPEIDRPRVLSWCKDIIRISHEFSSVERGEKRDDQKRSLLVEEEILLHDTKSLIETLTTLSKEINDYTDHLEAVDRSPIELLKKEITDIDEARDALSRQYDPMLTVSISDVERIRDIIPAISPELHTFSSEISKIYNTTKLTKLSRFFDGKKNRLAFFKSEYYRLKEQEEQLRKEYEGLSSKHGVPAECLIVTCSLRQVFESKSDDLKERLSQTTLRCEKMRVLTEILEKHCSVLDQFLSDQRVKHRNFKKICSEIFSIPSISSVVTEELLMDWINCSPLRIINHLDSIISHTEMKKRIDDLDARKQKITADLNATIKSNTVSSEFVKTLLAERTRLSHETMSQLNMKERRLSDVKGQLIRHTQFDEISTTITKHLEDHAHEETYLLISKAIDYWKRLREACVSVKLSYQEDLRRIETVVREQELLRARYDEEIIKQLDTLSERKRYVDLVELACSPNSGVPHKYMVRYLNALIHNVNYFVSQIYTYRLQIAELSEEKDIDYTFSIHVGNEHVPDISTLSPGQQQIIDFAWTLTLLSQLKLLDKIPLYLDEPTSRLDPEHTNRFLEFLKQLIDSRVITQMFLISHAAILFDGFQDNDSIILSPDGDDVRIMRK